MRVELEEGPSTQTKCRESARKQGQMRPARKELDGEKP